MANHTATRRHAACPLCKAHTPPRQRRPLRTAAKIFAGMCLFGALVQAIDPTPPATPAPAPAATAAAPAAAPAHPARYEDQPGWDCNTMGDHGCGPGPLACWLEQDPMGPAKYCGDVRSAPPEAWAFEAYPAS
jgi:hypothetical protein